MRALLASLDDSRGFLLGWNGEISWRSDLGAIAMDSILGLG
ncbi:MAG: hypothetical protein AAFY57_02255 [Cyanobacteria bacterium J06642_2]